MTRIDCRNGLLILCCDQCSLELRTIVGGMTCREVMSLLTRWTRDHKAGGHALPYPVGDLPQVEVAE